MEYLNYVTTLAGVVAGTLILAEYLGRLISADGPVAWIVSLVSAQAICFAGKYIVGDLLQIGMFQDTETMVWLPEYVAYVGFGATLIANGVFSLDIVKAILSFLKVRVV